MEKIQLNISDVLATVSRADIEALAPEAAKSLAKLTDHSGLGNDFLGWVKLPTSTDEKLLNDIEATAKALREDCEYVVAIGIGGSYLGAKAVIEALGNSFAAYLPGAPKGLFARKHIGED